MAQATISGSVETPLRTAAQLPFGWQKFETERLELWLPASYLGGDPRHDLRSIFERPELAPVFQWWKTQPDSRELTEEEWRRWFAKMWCKKMKKDEGRKQRLFVAFDTEIDTGHVLDVEVVVFRLKLPLWQVRVPFRTHVATTVTELSALRSVTVLEHSIVPLGAYESGRLVTEGAPAKRFGRTGPAVARQLWYLLKGKNELLIIRYHAPIDAWNRQLPIFEKSAATLRLQGVDAA